MSGVRPNVKAEPNLTPILDMVFQLVTFFMMVMNFKAAELDMDLHLPVVGSALPVARPADQLLVLNIRHDKQHPNGFLTVQGAQINDVKGYIQREGEQARTAAHLTLKDVQQSEDDKEPKALSTMIVLRADREAPFQTVNYVITCCQEQGFRKFAFRAMNKERAAPGS